MSETLSRTRTRAAIADALKKKYPLPRLRERFGIAKSACYCHASGTGESPKMKKDGERGVLIKAIFNDSMEIYGYRRIRAALERAAGIPNGHKAADEGSRAEGEGQKGKEIQLAWGEITAAPENLVRRNS